MSPALPMPSHGPSFDGLTGAIRYSGVLVVWLALFAVRPRLAIDIYRHRRPDSPLRRRP